MITRRDITTWFSIVAMVALTIFLLSGAVLFATWFWTALFD